MILTSSNLQAFLERFYSFDDGIVVRVALEMKSPRRCTVLIEAGDRESKSGWSLVTLTIHMPSEFRFEAGKGTFVVLSGGIQIAWRNGRIVVVFDAYPDDGDELPDLATNMAYVEGESCDFEATELGVVPYRDRDL